MDLKGEKKNLFWTLRDIIKNSLFNVHNELLKNFKIGNLLASLFLLISYIQIMALLFDKRNSSYYWDDEYFLEIFQEICDYIRVIPKIIQVKNVALFWIIYFLGVLFVLLSISSYIFISYCAVIHKFIITWPINLLRILFLLMIWVCFLPFLESFLLVFQCSAEIQEFLGASACFTGLQIFFMIFSVCFIILYLFICIIAGLFFTETQENPENAFSKLQTKIDFWIILKRIILLILCLFWTNLYGNWVLEIVTLLSSIILCFHYFSELTYFNLFVSVFHGSLHLILVWISINGLLVLIFSLKGNLIVILIGIPIIIVLVKNLRERRMMHFLTNTLDKIKTDTDILIQILSFQRLVKGPIINESDEITLTGIVNVHSLECQALDCPCKKENEIYCALTNKYSERNLPYHKDKIFLNHFNKKLYEDAIQKFPNSINLNIAFSSFLYSQMKNIHAALIQIFFGEKKKPSIVQEFEIFRMKLKIEEHLIAEFSEGDQFSQLPKVIDFENLLLDCQKSIETTCNFQIEFWNQLTNVMPDLNQLNELRKKILKESIITKKIWNNINEINPENSKALTLYGSYLNEIKNDIQLGQELLEKAKEQTEKKSINAKIQKSDILFNEDSAIIHLSGNLETAGRIVKANTGFTKLFGYNKSETIGHLVDILMPSLFADKHKDFLQYYFKTGKSILINKERLLFAQHRNGYCFNIKLMIRQLASLKEGIQYVGLIRNLESECNYIITDYKGVIDSFTIGLSTLFQLSSFAYKENKINIQVIAPDLMKYFGDVNNRQGERTKYKENGGHKLNFIFPQGLEELTTQQTNININKLKFSKKSEAGFSEEKSIVKDFNRTLNKSEGISVKFNYEQIIKTPEYINYTLKKKVKCEINELEFGSSKSSDTLRLKVFKILNNPSSDNNEGNLLISSEEANETRSRRSEKSEKEGETFPNLKKLQVNDPEGHDEGKSDLLNYFLTKLGNNKNDKTKENLEISKKEEDKEVEKEENKKALNPQDPISSISPISSDNRLETKIEEKFPQFSNKYETNYITGEVIKISSIQQNIENKEGFSSYLDKSKIDISKEETKNNPNNKLIDLVEEIDTPEMSLKNIDVLNDFSLKKSNRGNENDLKEEESEKDTNRVKIQEELKLASSQNTSENKIPSEEVNENKLQEFSKFRLETISKKGNIVNNLAKKAKDENEKKLIQNYYEEVKLLPSFRFNDDPENKEEDKTKRISPKEQKIHKPQKEIIKIPVQTDTNFNSENSSSTNFVKKDYPLSVGVVVSQLHSLTKTDQLPDPEKSSQRKFGTIESKGETFKSNNITDNSNLKKKTKSRIIENPFRLEHGKKPTKREKYTPSPNEIMLRKNLLNKDRKSKKDPNSQSSKFFEGKEEDENNLAKKSNKKLNLDIDEEDRDGDNDEENNDRQSSITSGKAGTLTRAYNSIRSAIEEKFIPPILFYISIGAIAIFLSVVALSIIFIVFQYTGFSKMNELILNLEHQESRIDSLIDLNIQIRDLIILQLNSTKGGGYLPDNVDPVQKTKETRASIIRAANNLQNARNIVSAQTAKFSKDENFLVNPQIVNLTYLGILGMPTVYSYTIWQTLIEMIVSSFQIASMDINTVKTDHATVYFVTVNSINSVLLALRESKTQLIKITKNSINGNLSGFLIILIIISSILFVSQVILFPLILKIKRNDENVLRLFLSIRIKNVEEQLKKCKQYAMQFHSSNENDFNNDDLQEKNEEQNNIDNENDNDNENENHSDIKEYKNDQFKSGTDKSKGESSSSSSKRSKPRVLEKNSSRYSKKFKKLNSDLGFTLIKLIMLVLLMEGYFLMVYFLSFNCLNSLNQLTDELILLKQRHSIHSLLYLSVKETILMNGNANTTIEKTSIEKYLKNYYTTLYDSEEILLTTFSSNINIHSSEFNTIFSNLFYSNICDLLPEFSQSIQTCEEFNQGILKKGIYSTVIKFWDTLNQLYIDFSNSSRDDSAIKQYLKDQRLIVAGQLQELYFNVTLNFLVEQLKNDINLRISNQLNIFKIIFIIFIIYLILSYFFIWNSFIDTIQEEYWKSKIILEIIPPELITILPIVKEYLSLNSTLSSMNES